jgi:hypothetical protein
MTAEMKSNNEPTRIKFNQYRIIVAIFLFTSIAMAISFSFYDEYVNPPENHGLVVLHYPSLILLLSFFVIPSLIGAVKLLRGKNSLIPSIVALVIWTIPFLALASGQMSPRTDLYWKIFGSFLFGLDLIMIAFVIRDWKTMFKKNTSI